MGKWQRAYLSEKKDIVFVALNPTKESNKHRAVFCTHRTFWSILLNAGLITHIPETDGHAPFKNCASEIFEQGLHSKFKIGFADLVEDCLEKKSSNVKVSNEHVERLIERLNSAKPKKIVLLGNKVSRSFTGKFPHLKQEWKSLSESNKRIDWEGKRIINYGRIGLIEIDDQMVEVFVMPFPGTYPLPKKHEFFKKIL